MTENGATKPATDTILVETDGPVGRIVFSRPERLNAISTEMWQAIPEIIAGLADDPDVRVVVLSGAGDKAFVAGADISQFSGARSTSEAAFDYERMNGRAFAAIRACPKPTIAMIDGYCIGGGLAIALCCDLRYASDVSTFAIPAARLGLAYPIDGIAQMLRVVTPAIAKEVFFTAKRFDAQEAFAMQLINKVLPRAELEVHVDDICARICENAPLTMRAAKHAIDAIATHPESFDRSEIEAHSRACFESADYREGQTAFGEKRKPVFTGK